MTCPKFFSIHTWWLDSGLALCQGLAKSHDNLYMFTCQQDGNLVMNQGESCGNGHLTLLSLDFIFVSLLFFLSLAVGRSGWSSNAHECLTEGGLWQRFHCVRSDFSEIPLPVEFSGPKHLFLYDTIFFLLFLRCLSHIFIIVSCIHQLLHICGDQRCDVPLTRV